MIAGTPFDIAGFDETLNSMPRRARRWVTREARIQSRARNAVCLVSQDGMVSIALQRRDDGTMRAFVLLAVSDSAPGAFRRNETAMLAIARDMGATTLAFHATRRGWAKVVGPAWKRDGDVYEREV